MPGMLKPRARESKLMNSAAVAPPSEPSAALPRNDGICVGTRAVSTTWRRNLTAQPLSASFLVPGFARRLGWRCSIAEGRLPHLELDDKSEQDRLCRVDREQGIPPQGVALDGDVQDGVGVHAK